MGFFVLNGFYWINLVFVIIGSNREFSQELGDGKYRIDVIRGTRTPKPVNALPPEDSVSTNSTIKALYCKFLSFLGISCFFKKLRS